MPRVNVPGQASDPNPRTAKSPRIQICFVWSASESPENDNPRREKARSWDRSPCPVRMGNPATRTSLRGNRASHTAHLSTAWAPGLKALRDAAYPSNGHRAETSSRDWPALRLWLGGLARFEDSLSSSRPILSWKDRCFLLPEVFFFFLNLFMRGCVIECP